MLPVKNLGEEVKDRMKKAFTLIELLVVIAIIAILAAMLMPALAKARAEAKKAACRGSQHGIGLALQLYLNDFNGKFPGNGDLAWSWVAAYDPVFDGSVAQVYRALYPQYLESLQMFQCPALETAAAVDPVTGEVTGGDYGIDVNIPFSADPSRAVLADNGTLIHTQGSVVLFVDSHVEWCPYSGPTVSDVVENPNLPATDDGLGPLEGDSDIYTGPGWPDLCRVAPRMECDADINAIIIPSP